MTYNNITINNQNIINDGNTKRLTITEDEETIYICLEIKDPSLANEKIEITKNKKTGIEICECECPRIKPITINMTYIKIDNEYIQGEITFNSPNGNKYLLSFQNRVFTLSFMSSNGETSEISTITYDEEINEKKLKSIINDVIIQILSSSINLGYFPITDHPLNEVRNQQNQLFNNLKAMTQNHSETTKSFYNDYPIQTLNSNINLGYFPALDYPLSEIANQQSQQLNNLKTRTQNNKEDSQQIDEEYKEYIAHILQELTKKSTNLTRTLEQPNKED